VVEVINRFVFEINILNNYTYTSILVLYAKVFSNPCKKYLKKLIHFRVPTILYIIMINNIML